MKYKDLGHVSDALIEVEGRSVEEVFEDAAIALIDTALDIGRVEKKLKKNIEVTSNDLEHLLYNWLEAVLIELEVEKRVYSEYSLRIFKSNGGYRLAAEALGEVFDPEKHHPKVEVKAVTYHLMEVAVKENGVTAKFLLDL